MPDAHVGQQRRPATEVIHPMTREVSREVTREHENWDEQWSRATLVAGARAGLTDAREGSRAVKTAAAVRRDARVRRRRRG